MNAGDRQAVEDFLFLEARCLDDARRWEEWLGLYAQDATYWIPYDREQADPIHQASIIYEDKPLLDARIRKLKHPRSWSQQPPGRTARVVGNVTIDGGTGAAGELLVHSTFHVLEFRRDAWQPYGGHYTHRLVREGAGLRIRHKRVDLISADGIYEHFIQIPL